MEKRLSKCRGCLLGLAVGDAMGYPVDEKSWEEIQENYGPNGLLGYDLVNDCATASANTQVAAFVSNGLLLGVSRGKQEQYLRYIGLSLKEWARAQHFPRDPERSLCWVAKIPQMRVRKSKDSRMLDALRLDTAGTIEKPVNRASSTGSLAGAVVAGLVCNDRGMDRTYAPLLGAQIVAMTHGNVETFLCGSVLCECIAKILEENRPDLRQCLESAVATMEQQFGERFEQAAPLAHSLRRAIAMSGRENEIPQLNMERMECDTAQQCLAAAIYACLSSGEDFDSAMITAVNHSGRSGIVASLTGAILGAFMGAEALPDFYLESLESAPVLEELAKDMTLCSPTSGLFDDDWDHKYVQGLPLI